MRTGYAPVPPMAGARMDHPARPQRGMPRGMPLSTDPRQSAGMSSLASLALQALSQRQGGGAGMNLMALMQRIHPGAMKHPHQGGY